VLDVRGKTYRLAYKFFGAVEVEPTTAG